MSTEIGAAPAATAEATTQETQSEEQAPVASADETTAQKVARMYKLKVNGKEEEVTEDVLLREAQIARAMRAKYQKEAARNKERDAWETRLSNADAREAALLERLGEDGLHDLAVKHLQKKLKHEMMSPEQKRYAAAQEEIAKLKSDNQKREESQKNAERKQLQGFFAQRFDEEIPAAMKSAGLPQTPAVLERFVALMSENIMKDGDLSAAEVAQYLRQEMRGQTKDFLKGLGDEDLDGLLDDELLERRRRSAISKAKANQRSARQSAAPGYSSQEPREKKELTIDDFREHAERIKRGGD